MFNPLKGLGDLNQLRKQAQEMQKVLAKEEIIVERDGIKVVMTGDQKVREILIDGEKNEKLERAVEDALKQVQQIMAKSLMSMQS
jgi:DNA-binding protein YbaB